MSRRRVSIATVDQVIDFLDEAARVLGDKATIGEALADHRLAASRRQLLVRALDGRRRQEAGCALHCAGYTEQAKLRPWLLEQLRELGKLKAEPLRQWGWDRGICACCSGDLQREVQGRRPLWGAA